MIKHITNYKNKNAGNNPAIIGTGFCILTCVKKSWYRGNMFYSQVPENYLQLHTPVFSSDVVPVKLYYDAHVFKSDIVKNFKDNTIIYMWFNKVTGEVYRGSK